jgi:hypothetical protein
LLGLSRDARADGVRLLLVVPVAVPPAFVRDKLRAWLRGLFRLYRDVQAARQAAHAP